MMTSQYTGTRVSISIFGNADHGANGLLNSIKYSIAYVSIASAKAFRINIASLQNKAGHFVKPRIETIQAAMDDKKDAFDHRFNVDLVNADGT